MASSIVNKRVYKKKGYMSIKEICGDQHGPVIEMHSSYSWPDLYYIGNSVEASRLNKKFGITEFYPAKDYKPILELRPKERAKMILAIGHDLQLKSSPVCSIGWSPRDQKWYGWSHRAINGFQVGSEIKKGNCGYIPFDKEDFIKDSILFWSDEYKRNINFDKEEVKNGKIGFWLKFEYNDIVPNESLRGTITGVFCQYPEEWGKGEWQAETLEDAKQMAIDFAESVS